MAGVGAAALCLILIAVSDSWRTAFLAALAGGALAATRIRFSGYVAAAFVALASIFIVSGPGIAS